MQTKIANTETRYLGSWSVSSGAVPRRKVFFALTYREDTGALLTDNFA